MFFFVIFFLYGVAWGGNEKAKNMTPDAFMYNYIELCQRVLMIAGMQQQVMSNVGKTEVKKEDMYSNDFSSPIFSIFNMKDEYREGYDLSEKLLIHNEYLSLKPSSPSDFQEKHINSYNELLKIEKRFLSKMRGLREYHQSVTALPDDW